MSKKNVVERKTKTRIIETKSAERPQRKFPAPPRKDPKLTDKHSRILVPLSDGDEALRRSRAERAVPSKTPSAPSKAVRKKAWDAGAHIRRPALDAPPAPPPLTKEQETTLLVRGMVAANQILTIRAARRDPKVDKRTEVDEQRVQKLVQKGTAKRAKTGKRDWTDEGKTASVPDIRDETAPRGRPAKHGDAAAREARALVTRHQKARARAKKWAVTERPAGISDADWELFALIERDGLTGSEAAARLGLTPVVARKRLQRVREEIEWLNP